MLTFKHAGCRFAVDADEVIGCVQAMLELSSMIAARVKVELRLKNFALQVKWY